MNYEQASAIGDVGERRVGDVLHAEAPTLGYHVLHNLLLIDNQTTAQLDHVLVDRFGIVVVETKNYHALIRGKSDERFWTACYRGKQHKNARFLNPLRQNDRHREVLQHVLEATGRRLPTGYVQSLVVFSGGDISHLKLDDHDMMRVIPERDVVDYLRARCGDFAPNPGALDREQVADLISLLTSLNQANNPTVAALHAETVNRATRGFRARLRAARRPAPAAPANTYASQHVFNQHSRYPDGSSQAPVRTRRPSLAPLLAPLVLVAIGLWLFLGGGMAIFQSADAGQLDRRPPIDGASSWGTRDLGQPAGATQEFTPVYDVRQALRQFKKADPQTYTGLVDRLDPELSSTNGLPTYTWQYVKKTGAAAASIRSVSITLDDSGRIVGVTNR